MTDLVGKPHLFLGIDPGSKLTGYAIVEHGANFRLMKHGTIAPPSSLTLSRRVYFIYEQFRLLLAQYTHAYQVTIGLETPFLGAFPAAFAALSNIRGALFVLFEQTGVRCEDLSPSEVKRAICGSGGGAKWSVEIVLKRLFPQFSPASSDEADALAIALCVAWKHNAQR